MSLMRAALLKAAESQWLAHNLPRYAFSRRAVRRFMPGEDLGDALSECQRLAGRGVGSVITRLGENITSLLEAHSVRDHYINALADIQRRAVPTHLSVKLTQLGLDISLEETAAHMVAISSESSRIGAPVWIDMESSRYVDSTLEVFRRTRAQHENVGLCVQAYLHRTTQDVSDLLEITTALRLVKGAYREPANVALQNKKDVDANYLALAIAMLERARHGIVGYAPAFATHDATLIQQIIRSAREMNVPSERYEFQMLYGIKTSLQQKLANENIRVRVLISYGSAWFAWYMRRLAERPANIWFVAKSVIRS